MRRENLIDADHHELKSCVAIQRLLIALRYYTNLCNATKKKNKKEEKLFCHFMDTIYKTQIYDDFHHLIKCHQSELESIIIDFTVEKYEFIKCDGSICLYSNRHFGINDEQSLITINDTDHNDSKYLNIYIETLDSLHFYLMHLYDCSLRTRTNLNYKDKDKDEKKSNRLLPYFDSDLNKISDQITNSRYSTERFPRLSTAKFNISVGQIIPNNDYGPNHDDDEEHDTFLDYMYQHLSSIHGLECNKCDKYIIDRDAGIYHCMGNDNDRHQNRYDLCVNCSNKQVRFIESIMKLKQIINDEAYCTESVDNDLEMFVQNGQSNISTAIQNKEILDEMVKIFKTSKSMFNFCVKCFCFLCFDCFCCGLLLKVILVHLEWGFHGIIFLNMVMMKMKNMIMMNILLVLNIKI